MDSGDYDNDGDIDFLFTYSEHNNDYIKLNGTINLLLNDGNNCFTNTTMIAWYGPGVPFSEDCRINPQLTSADYDNDGDIDFLVGDNSGMVELYLNDGYDYFTSSGIIHDFGYLSWGLTSADFDNDGDIDLIIACSTEPDSQKGYAYLKKNQLTETNMMTTFDQGPGEIIASINSIRGTACLQSLDYDNDGDYDLIAGTGDDIFLCNNTNGTFDSYYLGYLPLRDQFYVDYLDLGGMASGDFNNDGYDDFIVGGVQGNVRVFITNISQLPSPKTTISINSNIFDVFHNCDYFLADQNISNSFYLDELSFNHYI